MIQKKEIKCLQCQKKDKNEIIFNRCVNEHNVFNSDYKELLDQLLILPNKYGFYEKNENKKEKNINNTDIGKKFVMSKYNIKNKESTRKAQNKKYQKYNKPKKNQARKFIT